MFNLLISLFPKEGLSEGGWSSKKNSFSLAYRDKKEN